MHCFIVGAYVLLESGKVETVEQGQDKIKEVLKNGAAKLKMIAMLEAQGVKKHDARALFKSSSSDTILSNFSSASYVTHLSVPEEGILYTCIIII